MYRNVGVDAEEGGGGPLTEAVEAREDFVVDYGEPGPGCVAGDGVGRVVAVGEQGG